MLSAMPGAFSRLLFISVVTLIGVVFTVFALRLGGLSTGFAPANHAFLQLKNPLVALGGDEDFAPSNSMPALTHALELNPHVVLGFDVNRTLDGEWVLFRDDRLEGLTNGSGFIELKNWADIKDLLLGRSLWNGKKLSILKLVDVLRTFPHQLLFLNIMIRYPDRMGELVRILDPENSGEARFVVQSPFASALREIRKVRPLWLFGIDPSSVVRFLMMNGLYLETISDLNADVFVAPVKLQDEDVFTPRVIAEIQRRHKILMIESSSPNEAQIQYLKDTNFGFVTRHPAHFF